MNLAKAKALEGNSKVETKLALMKDHENMRQSSRRIRYVNGKIRGEGLTKIKIQNDEGEWVECAT